MGNNELTQSTDATAEMDYGRSQSRREPGLVIITGSSLGEFYSLADGTSLIVGRDADCDIVLQRPSVSRRHLRVEREGSQVTAADLNSKNGALVDQQPVPLEGVQLNNGDLIRVGDATLKYLDGRTPEARYHERSYRLATRDALTNLNNRLLFLDALARTLADWNRRGGNVSVALLDLDHFKQINDRFGHEAGDRVLQLLASILTSSLRASDLIARLGGEEFAVAFADTPPQDAAEILTKINEELAQRCQDFTDMPTASFSAGVASLPPVAPHNADLAALQNALLRSADQAMYQAKDAGRNKVVISTEELTETTGAVETKRHLKPS
ncbi:MAG: GGDEF domain-containing protein [Pseudomonadota bacterium]